MCNVLSKYDLLCSTIIMPCVKPSQNYWPSNASSDWFISWNIHLCSQLWYGFENVASQTCPWNIFSYTLSIPYDQLAGSSYGVNKINKSKIKLDLQIYNILCFLFTTIFKSWINLKQYKLRVLQLSCRNVNEVSYLEVSNLFCDVEVFSCVIVLVTFLSTSECMHCLHTCQPWYQSC